MRYTCGGSPRHKRAPKNVTSGRYMTIEIKCVSQPMVLTLSCGVVAEWLKVPVLKTGGVLKHPWVRIPPTLLYEIV